MCDMSGFRPETSFWQDFTIAEMFGLIAIRHTFHVAFKEWRINHRYLTELVMVLNWKIWQWHRVDEDVSALYSELWEKADSWALDHLQNEELDYRIYVAKALS